MLAAKSRFARLQGLSRRCSRMSSHDAQQATYLSEQCILVDERDVAVGSASKRDCHQWQNIDTSLHRAFSVFWFDPKSQLLLQRRASCKITFPDVWTNTCCSHPLSVPAESSGLSGVCVAARRKLQHELGVACADTDRLLLNCMQRIIYKSRCPNPDWGEHELDYVLLCRSARPYLDNLNVNEVSEVKYVDSQALKSMLHETPSDFSPWFRLIATNDRLFHWWNNLDDILSTMRESSGDIVDLR